MKTIAAAKFKEQCLAILDDVDPEGIIITKRGKPVARLMPLEDDLWSLYGKYADRIKVKGDIMSTGEVWNAES
ncbi:MAG: type II toxin-antitoxin system Phd/YefM family antitoxin [Chloroflexi bacterium]|nr:type II toxin-antitoxin system Phd/YefM family antitoxin [Chloroflexota bacterium]